MFAACSPELVFHLAAQIDVRPSVTDPVGDARTNVFGAINVLEAARRNGARRLVNTSTGGGLYGDADVLPTPEDHPIRALAPYGTSKHAAEGYVELYDRLHGLSTVSLRYGNVYGPRQDVHGEAGVVAIFCGLAMSGGTPTVFGSGGRPATGSRSPTSSPPTCWRPTGSDRPGEHRARTPDVGARADRGAQRRRVPGLAEPVFADARPGEVDRSCLDVSRAREALGWEARVTLRQGLVRIFQWLGAEFRDPAAM